MCHVRTLLQVICLSFVVVQTVNSYSFSRGISNITRIRRQSNRGQCPNSSDFACNSGECIDRDKECDGNVDCLDASDETKACLRIKCAEFAFRCDYGGCINARLECDGKPDCRDASDEKPSHCNTTEVSQLCKENQFRCSSGQCIPQDNKCDGNAECNDHSDEISATCWNIRCPEFSYRCKYGGCVNGKAECNSVVECFDGSDEDPNICGTKIPVPVTPATPAPVTPGPKPAGSCVLPKHPEFGEWSVQRSTQKRVPGNFVPSQTILRVKCKTQHKLEGKDIILCENGEWTATIGKCLKLCEPRFSTSIMTVTCISNNERETVNCTHPVDGTRAKFTCAPFYEDFNLNQNPFQVCKDGSWDKMLPTCAPVCGRKTVDAQKLIVNGSPVNKGDYPWQVALYTVHDMNLICGGSLLNQRVILTAAHCITDDKGNLQSKELYKVAVGKYFRQHNDSRDYNEAQFSELQHMFIPDLYKGSIQNYLGDIAILVTKKTFVLSRRVQPVCVDFGGNHNNPDANEFGYVTGWGYTVENAKPSDVLKELKVPAVSHSKCRNSLPEDYEIYLTNDKLCAGYLDNGTSVCSGDSGGGLVFSHDGRYYITGIVSLSPNSPTSSVGGCDTQQYGLYTKVAGYINDFILKKVSEFRP